MSENSSNYNNAETDLSFTNRDHLEWNQKKQDMILNLGLTNNCETDQTPTPTRFIRNCEEVGLFQDLQNVNPFDEVFKKAVENPTAINLQVPVSTCDDTLHTPQIYPLVEENSNVPKTNVSDQRDEDENPLIIVFDSDKDSDEEKPTIEIPKRINGISPVPLSKLMDDKRHLEILRQREANKAAQSRCRKRKQREIDDMKAENKILKRENAKLTSVNLSLQQTIKKLQEKLKEATSSKDAFKESTTTKDISNNSKKKLTGNKSKTVPSDKAIVVASPEVDPVKLSPEKIPKPPALAQQPVVISLPMQNIQNNPNTVVLVYPQAPQAVILPLGQQKADNQIIKDCLKGRFKKIMPK